MSIYDVNFSITSVELLPTHKRDGKVEDVTISLNAPLNDLSLIFQYLREGSTAGDYNAGTTYVFGEFINYQRRVYFRNEVTDGYVAGITPNTEEYFTKVLDNNIGLDERIRFGPQKIILEYALNRIFATTFNQPPVLSDIYIERNDSGEDGFFVGEDDEDTASAAQVDQYAEWFVAELDGDLSMADYTVFVPVAIWTALAGTSQERDNIILSVVNKFKLFGYTADVDTY
jgi:hypothetical protein